MVDSTFITALAGAVGSLVGASTSIAMTWISQRTESQRANLEWKRHERQTLYKEFITEASRLAVDAVTHSLEKPDQVMTLYGILSRIRLMSDEQVVHQGETCVRRIIEIYGRPNLTTDELWAAVTADAVNELDPLRNFSNACRNELQAPLA